MAALLDAPATSGQQQRLAQTWQEMDNLRAAFVWSRENSETTQALELASFLQPLWLGQGRIREGLAWIDTALAEDAADDRDVAESRVRASL